MFGRGVDLPCLPLTQDYGVFGLGVDLLCLPLTHDYGVFGLGVDLPCLPLTQDYGVFGRGVDLPCLPLTQDYGVFGLGVERCLTVTETNSDWDDFTVASRLPGPGPPGPLFRFTAPGVATTKTPRDSQVSQVTDLLI